MNNLNNNTMREILFRGKRIDNGSFVYGYYYPVYDDLGVAFILSMEDGVAYDVLPETVGQFTCLKDKNGIRIFEGDIVKVGANLSGILTYNINMETEIVGCFGFIYEDSFYPLDEYAIRNINVIGNIHDNPNLVK